MRTHRPTPPNTLATVLVAGLIAALLLATATPAAAKPPAFRGNPDDEFAELKKQFCSL